MPTRMTAVDAQFYWMSAKVPSDEFLLYAFGGEPTDFERAVDEVRNRAQKCRALTLRVEDGSPLTYPRWVSTAIEQDQVLRHDLDDASWGGFPRRGGEAGRRPVGHPPGFLAHASLRAGARHSGQHRPRHGRGHAVRARAVRRPSRLGDGRLAVRPSDSGT